MEKEKIHALVVVEGKSDTRKLQQYYDVKTFETSGMGLTDEMLAQLVVLAEKTQIIVLTDPDMPGEYIRNKIIAVIPTAQHIILKKKDTRSANGKRLGIEYANKEALDEAFQHIHLSQKGVETDITAEDMIDFGFIGLPDSRRRRDDIADQLHLGRVNGKQFLKRLQLFQITKSDIIAVLEKKKETRK